jgi:hypothetical protein
MGIRGRSPICVDTPNGNNRFSVDHCPARSKRDGVAIVCSSQKNPPVEYTAGSFRCPNLRAALTAAQIQCRGQSAHWATLDGNLISWGVKGNPAFLLILFDPAVLKMEKLDRIPYGFNYALAVR